MEPKNAPSSILNSLSVFLSLCVSLSLPPPHLHSSCIDVRQKDLRWSLSIGKNVGDAGTCFDLPEKGLFALEENREKMDTPYEKRDFSRNTFVSML